MFEKGQGGRGRKCCVLDGTVVRSLNYFLYKYIMLKSNYLIYDISSYIIKGMSHRDARGQTEDGGRRVSLETISPPIRHGPSFSHYLCQ